MMKHPFKRGVELSKKALTLSQSVILKKGLSSLIQSNVQRNVTVTVHGRERRTALQKETDKTNMDRVRIHLTAEMVTKSTQGQPTLNREHLILSHYLCLGCRYIQSSKRDQKALFTNKEQETVEK